MIEEFDNNEIRQKLVDLRQQHRLLDQQIEELQTNPFVNQLTLRRLKKEKLYLKDCIQRLNDKLIPDLNA